MRYCNAKAKHLPQELSDATAQKIQELQLQGGAPDATKNCDAIRRDPEADKDTIRRPAFLRDTEKILYIPAYNRLAGKTQVFSFRDNDDLTRRGLHVQLVSRVARDIGRALGLNVELIEAIALGHDIGHTPFGHAGERFLNACYNKRTNKWFFHNVQSVRVLDVLYGRNLTLQTLDGIICHNGEFEQQIFQTSNLNNFETFDVIVRDCTQTGEKAIGHLRPMTKEGCVVRIADIIAYVGKDRQDAIVAGLVSPDAFEDGLGGAYNAWALSAFTCDIIENSLGSDKIQMSEAAFLELARAKRENYEKIYGTSQVSGEFSDEVGDLFARLYDHELDMLKAGDENSVIFKHHVLPIQRQLSYYGKTYDIETDPDTVVCDFISSMTDEYFIAICEALFEDTQSLMKRHEYFQLETEKGFI